MKCKMKLHMEMQSFPDRLQFSRGGKSTETFWRREPQKKL